MESPRNPQELQDIINYTFKDRELLIRALTTAAYANEHEIPEEKTMDSLATLGDAVIDVIVIQSLIDTGEITSKDLTEEKVKHVKNSALPELASGINLIEFVRWGEGQKKEEHWNSDHLMSNCLESLIAAVYLDSGRDMNLTAAVFGRIEKLSR